MQATDDLGQSIVSLETRNIQALSREEIIELFTWLDFSDPLGHPLVNCQDFIDLVERATSG